MDVKRVKSPDADKLKIALKNLDGKVGKVGWFENSKYADKDSTPVAAVAAQNEYGNPNKHIPARPFMRPTIYAKQNEWSKIAENGSKSILKGDNTIYDVLQLLGLKAAGDIKRTISKLTEPPLSPKTIAARLSRRQDQSTIGLLTKPLIDTGIMLNTLTNSVEDE